MDGREGRVTGSDCPITRYVMNAIKVQGVESFDTIHIEQSTVN